MRNLKLFFSMIGFTVLFAACTNEMVEWQMHENLPIDMDTRNALTSISLASELDAFTLNASNGISTTGGYYWDQTYTNNNFQTDNFKFSHTGGAVSGYGYWDGFTVSNVADTTNYGAPGSSDGWIDHQWGGMAVPTSATNKPNFLVGYWGYYMLDLQNDITPTTVFEENKYSNWVKLGNNSSTYTVSKVAVSIHPWPFYGILYGDGFSSPFGHGDFFDLVIYGVKADGSFVTAPTFPVSMKSVTHRFADYPNDPNADLEMSVDWENVALDFGVPLKYLVFQMVTTDADPIWGPNTAVYFCLRDIVMQ